MRNTITALVLATVLGFISPFLASPDDGPILWTWFNWMPMRMDQWLMPESDEMALALDVGVLAVQYLLAYGIAVSAAKRARVARPNTAHSASLRHGRR